MKTVIVAGIGILVILGLILAFTRRQTSSIEQNETSKEGITSAGSPYGETSPSSGLRWIEANENPFGVRVFDCRSITYDMVSTTKDPEIAAKFTELRNSDGQQHRGAIPANRLHADLILTYPALGKVDGPHLFAAQQMEDKWDIYLWDDYLYFARSWTDDLIFRAKIALSDHGVTISSIDADSKVVNDDRSLAIRQVDFLIKSHLFKQQVPHPLPGNLPEDPQQIAIISFQLFGRWASYGTYEDTTKTRLKGSP